MSGCKTSSKSSGKLYQDRNNQTVLKETKTWMYKEHTE